MRTPSSRLRGPRGPVARRIRGVLAAVVTALLLTSVLVPTAALADDPPEVPVIHLDKTVSPTPAQRSLNPGDTATYSFNVECSSLTTACDNFAVTDTIPAPLTLGSVSSPAGVHSTITKTGNTFTVTFLDPLDDGLNGLEAGHQVGFTATAVVPSNVSATYNNQTVTNTASASASNVPDPVTSSADVKLAVPTLLSSSISKSFTPTTVNSSPGIVTTIAITPANTSNIGVTSLTVQEPADPTATPNPFQYDAITGLALPTWPGGANRVEVDWFNGTTWTAGTPKNAIALPTGVAPSTIDGLRFIFTNTAGTVGNAAGAISIATALRSNVTSIPATTTVHDIASDFVSLTDTSTTPSTTTTTMPVDGTADLLINQVSITPVATKSYADANPVGGLAPDEVTISGTNSGDYTLSTMVLQEPANSTPTLADQGLGFSSWDDAANEWPVGATSESVQYLYAGAGGAYSTAQTITGTSSTHADIPTPDPAQTVIGFRVTFGGVMPKNQYAKLHFIVTTPTVANDTTVTNTIAYDVTTNDGQTAEALASAPLNLRTARINTSVSKTITPGSIYSVSGASTLISLPAQIDPKPTSSSDHGGSTVGADSLTVQDTATPASDPFWDSFNPGAIVATSVPSGVSLTVNAWNASTSAWVPLDSATTDFVGPGTLTYVLTAGERASADGLQFVYTPTTGTLPPGFTVQPNIKAVLRATLRSDSSTAPNGTTGIVTVPNTVLSVATSNGASPTVVQATNAASVQLLPIPPGGIGMIAKNWAPDVTTGLKIVDARSSEQRTAVIHWGTGSQSFNSVVISDGASDPATTDVASTVYDAFNLVKIPAITTGAGSMDPLLQYDAISSVQLYIPGTGWTDTATNPCAADSGKACYGAFPGYTLTASESANATGVRLVYVENPDRAALFADDPNAPAPGSGVTATTDESRSLDLVFQIRDTKRSDGSPVLGTTAGTIYNDTAAGLVLNTAEIEGRDSSDTPIATGTASDAITILDRPINVTATKVWNDGPLGVPPVGTPQSFYPTAHLNISATNTSVAAVDELALSDPTEGDHPFDYVNITKIDSITFPTGANQSDTTVAISQDNGPTITYSVSDALALAATDLEHATGITVSHFGRIPTNASTDIQLDTQLRATVRGTADPVLVAPATTMTIHNTTTASITDPEVTQTGHTTSVDATATMDVDADNYGVAATKSIVADTTSGATPAIQYDGSSNDATINLSGQPTGNVPTTRMTIDDSTASFWNAFNFGGFNSLTFATPINRVEVDALVGITYDTSSGITPLCNGSTDLTDCWYEGDPSTTLQLPSTVPSGTTDADIRGLRFIFTKDDYSNWQRPHNPLQTVSFVVTRRTDLVAPAGTPATPVDDDLYTHTTPAPGETTVGEFTNTAIVTVAAASGPTDQNPLWSATESATAKITYQHLPADVQITKTPAGDWPLGSDIPYAIAVSNTGSGHDKPLTGVVVTDTLPGDPVNGPDLVLPDDPDTSEPLTLAQADQAFSYTLTSGGSTTTLSNTDVVAVMSPANSDGTQDITFTLASGESIPLGATLTINTTLDFRTGLLAYTPVENTATVVSDQNFDNCDYTTSGVTQTTQTDVASCTTTTTTFPQPSAPLTIVKGVRGDGAGPLDAAGNPLIDPATSAAYDDLGVLKTVTSSLNDCSTTNPSLAKDSRKGFYTYPCVPITRPGGNEEWESQFTNGGNIDLGTIVAIDVLPTQNDTGVIINSSRGSKWTPTLTSYPNITGIPANGSYVVEYTSTAGVATARCNGADIQNTMGMTATSSPAMLPAYQPCLTNTGAADDLPNRVWNVLPTNASPALLASVVALKFVVSMGDGLAPGGSIDITYESQTANNIALPETTANLGRDSIAYNSIAGAAIGRDPQNLPYPFVSEPRKVGVALATGGLNLLKLDTGPAAAAVEPATNNLTLTCKSNGVPVQIFDSNGVARSPFTVTPGSPFLVQGLPLYSVCKVTEPTSYGQTSKTIVTTPVASSTIVAEAAHTTPSVVYNPHPAFDDAGGSHRPAIQESTVTNDYEYSDFTVTKTIDNGGALDASGNPITYKSPSFSVSCTFNNGTATPVTITPTTVPAIGTTFALANGGSRTFTNVPAGSVCVVKETTARGAASTGYVVTSNGTTQVTGSTVTSMFTVAPNPTAPAAPVTPTNTVAFTNTYTTGSLLITKALAGAGAATWGSPRTFTLSVGCTSGNTTLATPFAIASFTLSSPSNLTKTINNLPTGAVCTVAEAGAAGATTSVVSGTATIVAATTKNITVTNTYQDATLTVTKSIHSSAVDAASHPALENYAFPVSVDCTFQGQPVVGTAPGYTFGASTMDFTLTQSQSLAISGLPAGASCVITETNNENADSSTIAVANANAGSTTPGTTATVTLTPDTAAPAGTNTATITNNYGVTSYTVTKVLAGGGAAQFAATSFTVHVTCSAPGIPVSYDGNIVLSSPSNLTKTINNLAENSICSVVEQGNRGTTGADKTTYLDSDGGTDGVGVLATIVQPGSTTITNWYLTGEILVTKKVTGAGGALFGEGAGQFTINLTCTRRDVGGNSVTVIIPGGSSRTMSDGQTTAFTELPSGASCALIEMNAGGASSTAILDSSNVQVSGDATSAYTLPQLVTVNANVLTDNQSQPGYTVQNTFDLDSFAITKLVDSSAVNAAGTPVSYGPFPVSVTCTFDGHAVYATGYSSTNPMQNDLAANSTWNLGGLTTGTSCDVTETDAKSATGTSISVVTGTNSPVVTPGTVVDNIVLAASTSPLAANTATITNSYQAGTIVLSKIVTGAGAAAWGQGQFTINVSCTLTDGTGVRSVWNKDYTFVDGAAPIELDNVASGAACVVTETKTGGANSTTIALDGGAASIETTAPFTSPLPSHNYDVVVTNRFDVAQIDVTKNRVGAGATLYGDGPFEVTLVCTRLIDTVTTPILVPGGATRSLDSTDLYRATYTGLPAGATCVPTETKSGGANSTVIAPSTITTDSSTPTDLEITNTFDVGTIMVTKTITGAGALLYGNGPFEVSIACTRVSNGQSVSVDIPGGNTRELSGGNGYANTFDNLPAGALCDVTESKTSGATTSTFTTASSGIAVVAGTSTPVNLTNEFDVGFITVDNLVTGNDATPHLPDTYEVVLTCTQLIDGVVTSVDIPGGATRDIWHKTSITYENLPIGASCSLIESVRNQAQSVLITWHGMPVPLTAVTVGDPDFMIHVVNVYNIALGYTGVEVGTPFLLSLLALLLGLGIVVVQFLRRRRQEPAPD